jgi:putative ABC transport system substrate-binding protein
MNKRELITLLGAAAAAWPVSARGQQQGGKLPTIAFLGTGTASGWQPWVATFVQRLRSLGWSEGRTVMLEYRWGEGRRERFAGIAAEFVRLKVDIIVSGGSAVPLLKQATSVVPIVFVLATDPVGGGLVASLSRPGGNATGLSNQGSDLAGGRLEILHEVTGLRRLAILANVGFAESVLEMSEVEAAAGKLGIEVVAKLEIERADDIAPAFDALQGRADGLYVVVDGLVSTNRTRIFTLATGARLPTVVNTREHAEAGALMSYGPNFHTIFRRAAEYVDKILRGAKPADLPVEQPTNYDLVINLITAKAIGLAISPTLLARADEVIE